MNTERLQVFDNRCAACGARFTSEHLSPHDYESILYASVAGDHAFLSPDDDPTWHDVAQVVEEEVAGSSLDEVKKARIFHAAFVRTIDPTPSGEPYFPWGKAACPRCGGTERSYFGPVDPPLFVEVQRVEVTHRRWQALSPAEQTLAIRTAVRDFSER